jgi:hypothetical protein
MLLGVLLLRSVVAKVIVVDDLGLTDGSYNASPEDAVRLINVLGDTMKKSDEEVVLSNSTGVHKLINDLDVSSADEKQHCGVEAKDNCVGQDRINPVPGKMAEAKRPAGAEKDGIGTSGYKADYNAGIGAAVSRRLGAGGHSTGTFTLVAMPSASTAKKRQDEEYVPANMGQKVPRDGSPGKSSGRRGDSAYGGDGIYRPLSMMPKHRHDALDIYKPSNIPHLTSLLSGSRGVLEADASPLELDLMRREQDSMTGASRARESYIRLKISQSRQKEREIQTEIDRSQQHLDQAMEKLHELGRNKERILSKLHAERNHIRNLESNKKEVEMQRARTASLVRLARNELLKLTKIMDDQKSKLGVLEDEEQVFSDRIRKYDEDYEIEGRELQFDEARLGEVRRDIEELESIQANFKTRTNEFINQKNKEIALRNRLMLEKERLERNTIDFV